MRFVVHPIMIQAIAVALLKGDWLMVLVTKFVSNHVVKRSVHVKSDEIYYEPK